MRYKKIIIIVILVAIIGMIMGSYYSFVKKNSHIFDESSVETVQNLIDSGECVIIYYGSESCSRCVEFAPILKKHMDEVDVDIYYINSENEENQKFANKMNLQIIPSFIVYEDGKEKVRYEDDKVYDGMALIYNEHQ